MKSNIYNKTDANKNKLTSRQFHDERIRRFPERLKIAIGGTSVRKFAQISGLSEGVVRNYLSGDSFPSLDRLDNLAAAANVTAEWLITGQEAVDDGTTEADSGQIKSQDHFDLIIKKMNELIEQSTPYDIDEEMLADMMGKLDELIEDAGEEWTPMERAKLVAQAYREEKEEESLPEKHKKVINLLRAAS